MAFTLWSFPWSSFWGGGVDGGIEYATPPQPAPVDEVGGAFWLARDSAGTGNNPTGEVRGADSMGWAPGNMAEYEEAGDVTLIATENSGTTSLRLVRSDYESGIDVRAAWAEVPGPIHAELFGHQNVTGMGGAAVPAFVMFNKKAGAIWSHNVPMTDLATVNSSVVWNNELAVEAEVLRFVSLETSGTAIVIQAPSVADPLKYAFYLKSTFGSGAAAPATEIPVDLVPSGVDAVVPGRFHVVETHNRALIFYYEVIDSVGTSHVACMVYTPYHATFGVDLPFNIDGVVVSPAVVLSNHRPIDSVKGARRHQVSNSVMVGVEPGATTEQGLEIHWYVTHGYGYSTFEPPIVWNATTHPNLFGGRIATAAKDRVIRIISVGWAEPRQGGVFPVVGYLQTNAIAVGSTDFINFYNLGAPNEVFKRLCLGTLYAPRPTFDSNPGGRHQIRYGTTGNLGHNESRRNGYHFPSDFLSAISVLPLDQLDTSTTPALRGPPGDTSGGLVPTSGIVGSAIYFYDAAASVSISNDGSFTTPGVTISCWVFPEMSGAGGDPDSYTIAMKWAFEDPAYRLWWNEATQTILWAVWSTLGPPLAMSSISLGALPPNHWYHVTATYDNTDEVGSLYINGFLVSSVSFPAGAVINHGAVPRPVVIGYNPSEPAYRSFQGRVDDFVVGHGHAALEVQASYFYSLLSKSGEPMRGARTAHWRYQDQVVSTVSVASPDTSGRVYTVSMRRVNMSSHALLRNQLVCDVWRIERGKEPVFLGIVPLHPDVFDQRGIVADTITAPTVDSPDESFEMRLVRATLTGESATWNLFYSVRGDEEGGVDPRVQVYWQGVDLNNPAAGINSAHAEIVAQIDDGRLMALDVVTREESPGVDSLHVLLSVKDWAGLNSSMFVLKRADFGVGALFVANFRNMNDLMPLVSTEGSFDGRDYRADFGGAKPPQMRGIVSRRVVQGMGTPPELYNGVQVIFGLESTAGGADAVADQSIGTFVMYLGNEVFDTPFEGNFPLPDNGLPRQLDEYGVGGIDPFIPLAWMPHPTSPTGDSILLGRTGTRIYSDNARDGNGGLMLYSVTREGFWGVRACASVGPCWSAAISRTIGASAAISIRPGAGTEEPVHIYVSRPHPDRADKFSTVFISPDEAISGGWSPEDVSKSVIPILRRNDRVSTTLWTGHALSTRNLTSYSTGTPLKTGKKFRYSVVLRWSFPGSTSFTPVPV